ncbi:MAG: CAP domain-containing protein [Dehalobacterium sp.]
MIGSLWNIGSLISNINGFVNLGRRFGLLNPQTQAGLGGNMSGGLLKSVSQQPVNKALKLKSEEQKMINMVNAERMSHGLRPLEIDMRLVDTSRIKARDMLYKNYFDHYSPGLGSPQELIERMRVPYKVMGENLARVPTVENAHIGLMRSPGHRANILNPDFKRIGVGIITGGADGKLFTQHFIG